MIVDVVVVVFTAARTTARGLSVTPQAAGYSTGGDVPDTGSSLTKGAGHVSHTHTQTQVRTSNRQ